MLSTFSVRLFFSFVLINNIFIYVFIIFFISKDVFFIPKLNIKIYLFIYFYLFI